MGIRFVERHIITMKLLVVVLALASLALAEPEADPAYLYRGYYGYHPYAYRPYGYGHGYYNGFYRHSAYGHGLPNGYAHVSRVHKREADAQVVAPVGDPLAYNPLAYGLGLPAAAYHTPLTATVKSVPHCPYLPEDCHLADGYVVRAYYGGYGYGGYGGYGYPYSYYGGYGYPYATYPYAAPVAAP